MMVLGSFRSGMKEMYRLFVLLSAGLCALLLALGALMQIERGEFPDYGSLFELGMVPVVLGLLGLAVIHVASLVYRIQILLTGLRCYDARGKYHILGWSDITRVEPVTLLNLSYLEIEAKNTPAIVTLPLFLTDMRRFTNLAIEAAGGDNPLVIALREHAGHRGANAPASSRPA
jgi:hypothetical protein